MRTNDITRPKQNEQNGAALDDATIELLGSALAGIRHGRVTLKIEDGIVSADTERPTTKKTFTMIKKIFGWALGAIASIILGYTVGWFLPPERVMCEITRLGSHPPSSDLTVLVASIAGDSSRTNYAEFIKTTIEGAGIRTRRICKPMPESTSEPEDDIFSMRKRKAQEWLDRYEGDILIWGRILNDKATAYFTSRGEGVVSDLHKQSELDDEFLEKFGGHLLAILVVHLVEGMRIADDVAIKRLSDKLRKIRKGSLLQVSPKAQRTIAFAHGAALSYLAAGKLDVIPGTMYETRLDVMKDAVNAFHDALSPLWEIEGDCRIDEQDDRDDEVFWHWAIILAALGDAHVMLYGLDDENAVQHLLNAVAAYGCGKLSLGRISEHEHIEHALLTKLTQDLNATMACRDRGECTPLTVNH